MTETKPSTPPSESYYSKLLGTPITSLKPLSGGRNSRVFQLTTESGDRFVAKIYQGTTADGRSRVESEYCGLDFLRRQGLKSVPLPIVLDGSNDSAIYSFIEGKAADTQPATESDIDQITEFLSDLNTFKTAAGAENLPPAAEACFSLQAITDNILNRINRLQSLEHGPSLWDELQEFLSRRFKPAYETIDTWVLARWQGDRRTPYQELSSEERTLSPSDIGLHNCIRRWDGRLAFLDFEYFGWDDPAKMLADFVLHPAMDLGSALKERFIRNILHDWGFDVGLRHRFQTVYPLFGLKWCLILLNEFLPERMVRRRLASNKRLDASEIQSQQLHKARNMLCQIENEYEACPYIS